MTETPKTPDAPFAVGETVEVPTFGGWRTEKVTYVGPDRLIAGGWQGHPAQVRRPAVEQVPEVTREEALATIGKVWAGNAGEELWQAFNAGNYPLAKQVAEQKIAEQAEYSRELTPDQEAIRDAAEALLETLRRVVPDNVAHYAVEEAMQAARKLARKARTVRTHDATDPRVEAAREEAEVGAYLAKGHSPHEF